MLELSFPALSFVQYADRVGAVSQNFITEVEIMKICASCGESLPDQAPRCVRCGSSRFTQPDYGYDDQYDNGYAQNGRYQQQNGQYAQQYDDGYDDQYDDGYAQNGRYQQQNGQYAQQYDDGYDDQYDDGYAQNGRYQQQNGQYAQQYDDSYAQNGQYQQQYAQHEQYEQQQYAQQQYAQPQYEQQQYAQQQEQYQQQQYAQQQQEQYQQQQYAQQQEQYAQQQYTQPEPKPEPEPEPKPEPKPEPEPEPEPEQPKVNPYEVSKNFVFEKKKDENEFEDEDEDEEGRKKIDPLKFFKNALNIFINTPDHSDDYDPAEAAQNKGTAIAAMFGITFWVPLAFSPKSLFSRFYANQGLLFLIFQIPFTILFLIFSGIVNLACTQTASYAGESSGLSPIGWIMDILLFAICYAIPIFVIVLSIRNIRACKAKEIPILGFLRLIK